MSSQKAKAYLSFVVSGILAAAMSHASDAVDPSDVIVAERGGAVVTLQEVDAQVMQLPRHLRAAYLDDPERIEQVVGGLLLNKQIANQAKEWGVEADPYFEAQLENAKATLLSKRATALNEDRLVAEKPDFETLVEEIYLTHPDRFERPAVLKLEHVLVTKRGRSDEDAMARAKQAQTQLTEGVRPFAEIFSELSDEALEADGPNAGILSNIVPGMTEVPFEEVVFQLTRVGEVSSIIQTRFGLHVVRLLDREEPKTQTFEEVKATLIAEQQRKYMQQGKTAFLTHFGVPELKAVPEVVAQLRTRYARAAQGELPPPVVAPKASEQNVVVAD